MPHSIIPICPTTGYTAMYWRSSGFHHDHDSVLTCASRWQAPAKGKEKPVAERPGLLICAWAMAINRQIRALPSQTIG